MTPEDSLQVEHASRRVTGFAALRQIRKIVDQELATDALKSRWASRIGVFVGIALIVIITWVAFFGLR